MKRSSDAFVFTPELGARLRALRERAGLSQGQLMLLAGRVGKGAGMVASRLERGKIPYPSLGLIVDYLRACRAGFRELADLLGPATMKPVPSESPEERSRRLDSFVASVAAGASVKDALAGLLDSHGWSLSPRQRRALLRTMCRTWRLAMRWPRHWDRTLARNMDRPIEEAGRVVVPKAFVEVVALELWDLIERLGPAPGSAAQETGDRIQETGDRIQETEYRIQNTEYRTQGGTARRHRPQAVSRNLKKGRLPRPVCRAGHGTDR